MRLLEAAQHEMDPHTLMQIIAHFHPHFMRLKRTFGRTDLRMDGPTDLRTDTPTCRDA